MGDLGREGQRHHIGGAIGGAAGVARLGVGRERVGGGDLGGRVREALGVHLMVVDRLAARGRLLAVGQRLVEGGARRREDDIRLVEHATM